MKKSFILAALAAAVTMPVLTAPAVAQSSSAQRRWDDAQRRYDVEFQRYLRERDLYTESRLRRGGPYRGSYNDGPGGGYPQPYSTDYDATRYYRSGSQYQERRLTAEDEVYRGSDGRYYCKRSDGTTGLIIGAGAGALLGNVVDGGSNRVAGTLVGGVLGAFLGREVEQSADVRCR